MQFLEQDLHNESTVFEFLYFLLDRGLGIKISIYSLYIFHL